MKRSEQIMLENYEKLFKREILGDWGFGGDFFIVRLADY
jgi:hypothetical protein